MRPYLTTIAAFAFLCGAILLNARSPRGSNDHLARPPLPIGQHVQLSVEPRETTGESLATLTGLLTLVDEEWVSLVDSAGRVCWIPRERVILMKVLEDA